MAGEGFGLPLELGIFEETLPLRRNQIECTSSKEGQVRKVLRNCVKPENGSLFGHFFDIEVENAIETAQGIEELMKIRQWRAANRSLSLHVGKVQNEQK